MDRASWSGREKPGGSQLELIEVHPSRESSSTLVPGRIAESAITCCYFIFHLATLEALAPPFESMVQSYLKHGPTQVCSILMSQHTSLFFFRLLA